jgi:hypothetical protein
MILVEAYDGEDENAKLICLMTFENQYKFDTFFSNCSFDEELHFEILDYEVMNETLQ